MAEKPVDKEVELYRSLLETPTEFKDGFGWSTVVGIIFCGLVMMPGGIYLGLMTGQGIGSAASWVTVILFMEIARRAMKPMSKQHLVVLLHAASVMMMGHVLFPGGPMGEMVYRAYLAGSDAARDAGMYNAFPTWFVPSPDSPAILNRDLFHVDWFVPIAIIVFLTVVTLIKRYALGYVFFRLTSDIEQLPFPLAPIAAQGAMALAESDGVEDGPEQTNGEATGDDDAEGAVPDKPAKRQKSTRARIFSLGVTIGLAFGFIQVGIPAISGLFLSKPFFLVPQPFVDTTTMTETLLPATPTGVVMDLGIVFLGFVLPFWSVIGTFIAILLTAIMNPLLHVTGYLPTWRPGMDTVNTTFANSMDFWMSFGIGSGLGIAAVCLIASIRDAAGKMREIRKHKKQQDKRVDLWAPPNGERGDCPLWIAIVAYIISSASVVILCYVVLPKSFSILAFLLIFAFIYSPLLSYVNARLLGISGQSVDIPFVRETFFLLSGAKGVDIWLAPVPIENFGPMTQSFRINELTGVRFGSLLKTDLVALPVLLVLSLFLWGFIWKANPIPSDVFPAAQINWELQAKNQVLLFSSTHIVPGEDPNEKSITNSEFWKKAVHPEVIGAGFVGCVILYGALSAFNLPIMLIYGMVRGFGALPHTMVLEVLGALLGRYWFQKKYGQTNFLKQAPALMAGYFTGVGLISMFTIAMQLMKNAISGAPF
ncbi:MAG TPA: peptide transporter [Lentisphaeria bacterium]|nr:peptide transporter [Lentisphaeria bacterium]